MCHPKRQLLFVLVITIIIILILDCLEICYIPKGKSILPSTQDLCPNTTHRGSGVFQFSINKIPFKDHADTQKFLRIVRPYVLFCQSVHCTYKGKIAILSKGQVTCQRSHCEMGNKQSIGPGHPTALSIIL